MNQDEFSHRGRGAKKAFLAEIERAAGRADVPALLVDKINTMRQHRQEILKAMQSGGIGHTALIQFVHPQDPAGQWDHAMALCESRIKDRGRGHRTLMGDEPKLREILRNTVAGVQAMEQEEMGAYVARIDVDMTQEPVTVASMVISALFDHGLLPSFDPDELLSNRALHTAMQAALETETGLAAGATPANGSAAAQVLAAKAKPSKANKAKPSKANKERPPAPLWIWVLELDSRSCEALRVLWDKYRVHVGEMSPVDDLHVTLLYLGGGSDGEIAGRHPHLGGPEGVARLKAELANAEGREVHVDVKFVVWDERIAAVELAGLDGACCANRHPHVTLAAAKGIPPRVSNELLARRGAAEDLHNGLGPWLSELGLAQYAPPLLEWCAAMGAATPEEIAENAPDAAAAIENRSVEERSRIQDILARSAPGELCGVQPSEPVRLCGRISGRRRGQRVPG